MRRAGAVLWREAQGLARAAAAVSPRAVGLPPLLFFTDPQRTPQPWRTAAALPAGAAKAGMWGMDLYSLYESQSAVLAYLDGVDPAAAARARERYGCFAPFAGDPGVVDALPGAG